MCLADVLRYFGAGYWVLVNHETYELHENIFIEFRVFRVFRGR